MKTKNPTYGQVIAMSNLLAVVNFFKLEEQIRERLYELKLFCTKQLEIYREKHTIELLLNGGEEAEERGNKYYKFPDYPKRNNKDDKAYRKALQEYTSKKQKFEKVIEKLKETQSAPCPITLTEEEFDKFLTATNGIEVMNWKPIIVSNEKTSTDHE
jgi:hypothetical protein